MIANFTVSKTSGYVNITNFVFNTSSLNGFKYVKYLWDFGDSIRSRLSNPSHTYNNSGNYTITLNAYRSDGSFDVYKQTVDVKLLLNESIYFDAIPPPSFAGHYNRFPFKIKITSSSTNPHYVDLYANYSKSYAPQDPSNKWSFLRPEWRFLDLDGNVINQIKTEDSIIKVNSEGKIDTNGFVAGVTGVAYFYFVDDIYNSDFALANKPYSTIIATLQTSGIKSFQDKKNQTPEIESYSNSTAQIAIPHVVLYREPDCLKITENGSTKHRNPKWTNSDIPIIINPSNKTLNYNYDIKDGNGVKPFNEDFYFLKNIPDINDKTIIDIKISAINLNSNFTPTPIVFKYKDYTDYIVSGYYKGFFSIPTSSLNVKLTASSNVLLPKFNYFNHYMWIPNQMAGVLNICQYNSNSYTKKLLLNQNIINSPALTITIPTPIKTTTDFTNQKVDITGFNSLRCMAALQHPEYHAWGVDSELNKIYRFSSSGSILITIDIDKLLNKKYTTPYYCALDGNKHLWVTLQNTTSTLKFDNLGKLLFGFSPNLNNNISLNQTSNVYKWVYDSQYYPLISTETENFINPTCVDTDIKNNAWITYSNPFSSFLTKVSQTGNLLNTIILPLSSCPNEIVCDRDENFWLSLSNNIYKSSQFLQKRNTNGTLLSAFGPFNKINNLTIDYNQNLWFTHSYSHIGIIKKDGTYKSYKIPLADIYENIPDSLRNDNVNILNVDEPALNGIAYDGKENILIVNSLENKINMFSISQEKIIDNIVLSPKGFNYYPSEKESILTKIPFTETLTNTSAPTIVEYHPWTKSINVIGDWTGNKWYSKYGITTQSFTKTLTGESNIIDFYDKNPYEIFKLNENFDYSENLKSLAFTPTLRESATLFDEFLKNIYGNKNHEDLGVVTYEKISNYLKNNSDIDTCNIKSLYDLAESVDQDSDDFMIKYPNAVRRLMDLMSINKSKLWGAFLNKNYFVDIKNVGNLLDPKTYKVSAGTSLVLHSKTLKKYRYIKTGKINNLNSYDLYTLSDFLKIREDFDNNFYNYYSFVKTDNDLQVEGLIDWSNENTTLQNNMSSLNDWFGNEGIIETSYNYEIYKGLGFLD